MTTDLRERLAFARDVEPTEHEIAAVRQAAGEREQRPAPRWKRPFGRPAWLALTVALAIPAGAVAAGAFDDTLGSFFGLAKNAPLTADPARGTVIDEQQGVRFSVTRSDSGDVCLQLGGSVGLCGNNQDDYWDDALGDRAIAQMGTVAPSDPGSRRVPLFVLTAPGVTDVEVRYGEGPSITSRVGNGGAVVIVDASRGPREIVALDSAGVAQGRDELDDLQWKWCRDIDGCPEVTTP